jgi:uncharacterized protein (DUF3084 family)
VELGVLLIPILIIVSGAIALAGNAVGRGIGRRRLSLFGLRPRHTAQVITVITGVLITVTTLLAVLALSREARVALFRLNEVLRETRRLEGEIKEQEDRLRQLALGDIAYLNNQEVVRDVIDGRARPDVVRQRLAVLVKRGEEIAREAGISADAAGNTFVLAPPNLTWAAVVGLITQREAETVVRLVASQNTLRGEPLPVYVQMFDNRLIYRKGTVLASGRVDGRASREAIVASLFRLADDAARGARGKVLSPPFTIVTTPPNAVVGIEDSQLAVRRLQELRRSAPVQVITAENVRTVGPLTVRFIVVER